MKQLLFLIVFFLTCTVYGSQNDTIYLDENFQVNTHNVKKTRIIVNCKKDKYFVYFQEYTKGKWKKIKYSSPDVYEKVSESVYVKKLDIVHYDLDKYAKIAAKYFIVTKNTNEKSYVEIYSIDSTLMSEGYYTNFLAGIKDGQHKVYYPDGKIWRIQEYDNNLLVKSENFLKTGIKGHSDSHEITSELPLFKGKPFMSFEYQFWEYFYNTPGLGIDTNHKYRFEGLCVSSFVITSEGEFADFQIVQAAPNNAINALVRKYLSMNKDKWTPAKSSGKPVNFFFQWNLKYAQN